METVWTVMGAFTQLSPNAGVSPAWMAGRDLWVLPGSPLLSPVPTLEGDDCGPPGTAIGETRGLGNPQNPHLLPDPSDFQTEGLLSVYTHHPSLIGGGESQEELPSV